MTTQDDDPKVQPRIRDIDYTQGHIVILLAVQTNDQERNALTEKIILELVNKYVRLLKEKDILLVMSVHQLGKNQLLKNKSKWWKGTLEITT